MKFSVLLSIYKKESPEFFQRALQSVWEEQTRKPEQIVLIKDGPLTIELDCIIDDWRSKLGEILKVVELPLNVGLGKALNEGLMYCKYELVARMDTDDISMPERFEMQIEFMRDHPEVSVCSSYIEEFDENNITTIRRLPLEHYDILTFAKKRCPISHPAVIFRKSAVLSVGGYPEFNKAQDVALWSLLLSKGYVFANIGIVLVRMRLGKNFFSRRGREHLKNELTVLRFQKQIGFITKVQFIKYMLIRTGVRLSPTPVKKMLYKYARG